MPNKSTQPDQEPQTVHNFICPLVASTATNSSSHSIQMPSNKTTPGKQSPIDPVVNISASQLVAGNIASKDPTKLNNMVDSNGLPRVRFGNTVELHYSLD